MRKSGYYWISYDGLEHIAWFDADLPHPFKPEVSGFWHMCCAQKEVLEDADFDWIHEKQIKAPSTKGK